MFPKMWPRLPIFITVILLLSASLSACESSPTLPQKNGGSSSTSSQNNTLQKCGQYLGQQFYQQNSGPSDPTEGLRDLLRDLLKDSHAGDEARLFRSAKSSDSSGPGDCVNLMFQPNQPTIPISPTVQSNNEQLRAGQYPQNIPYRTVSYTYGSQTINNCSGSSPEEFTISYGIPVTLVLGLLDKNDILQPEVTYIEQLPPNPPSEYLQFPQSGQLFYAFDKQQEIARYLYYNKNLPQYFNRGKSGLLTIPPQSMAILQLPSQTIDYQAGWGAVNHNGEADLILSWKLYYEDQGNSNPTNLNQYASISQCG